MPARAGGQAARHGDTGTRSLGWFGRRRRDDGAQVALYEQVVALGRAPHWYVDGGVPDTLDGRFDAISAVLCVVLTRLEGEPVSVAGATRLTERFIDDMDAQLRQIGIGDLVVGKEMGRAMAMLGGRLGAYRDGLAEGDLDGALKRNLYRGEPPSPAALDHAAAELRLLRDRLAALPADAVLEGRL